MVLWNGESGMEYMVMIEISCAQHFSEYWEYSEHDSNISTLGNIVYYSVP